MLTIVKSHFTKLIDRIKIILMIIGIFSIFRLCYLVDDKPVVIPEVKKTVSKNKTQNVNTHSEFTNKITIENTNQKLLKKQTVSKYNLKDRIVEPIIAND